MTEGLSRTHVDSEDLVLRHGLVRVPRGADWDLRSITAREEEEIEARVRVLHRGQGPVVHELRFRSDVRRRGVTFTRRVFVKGQFALTAKRSRRPEFGGERTWEALFTEPSLPTRHLRFELRFASGRLPGEVTVLVHPRAARMTPGMEDLRPRLHPRGFDFVVDEERGLWRLDVRRPLVGFRYVFLWPLA